MRRFVPPNGLAASAKQSVQEAATDFPVCYGVMPSFLHPSA